ncbi:MAG: ATP-dependent DNA ligase [Candidatus Rokubacteria bacterium]|nr:ATP-dependent DNA ligase [Candidatus Rokubacteria bacterium]MBI3826865.1 ATP-dependent DNA ligase [Candidatus Rokubacteria bacterium]
MPADRVPFRVRPMLATPVDAPFHSPGWVYEEKYDGFRILAYKEGKRVSLITRNVRDRAEDFPDVAQAIARLPAPTLCLDGEIVIFDDALVSRFQYLQQRGLGDTERPPVYAVFDCLYARGKDLRASPLRQRRAALEREIGTRDWLFAARRLADDGLRAFEEACRRGLEGLVAKDESSVYEAGRRSRAWLKVKVRNEEELVIGGYTAPAGARTHFGAILVGGWDGPRLRYAGKVGTGYTAKTLADLARRFKPLERADSPFDDLERSKDTTWLEPRLVAQIGFTERTSDGKLRHPVYLGLRDDKSAREVTW